MAKLEAKSTITQLLYFSNQGNKNDSIFDKLKVTNLKVDLRKFLKNSLQKLICTDCFILFLCNTKYVCGPHKNSRRASNPHSVCPWSNAMAKINKSKWKLCAGVLNNIFKVRFL